MRKLYCAVLALYPAEYQAAFAREMIQLLNQNIAHRPRTGSFGRIAVATRELAGLIKGLFAEHAARLAAPDTYLTARCRPAPADTHARLDYLIRSMEHAIAHHDFPKARYYSDQERQTRAILEKLEPS